MVNWVKECEGRKRGSGGIKIGLEYSPVVRLQPQIFLRCPPDVVLPNAPQCPSSHFGKAEWPELAQVNVRPYTPTSRIRRLPELTLKPVCPLLPDRIVVY
jgi:hypothetical protein